MGYSRSKVLIADDNRDFTRTLAGLLELAGYEVVAEHDGSAALAAARTHRPGACVLDISMPGLNGFEVARSIRAELDEVVRLVAITGIPLADCEDRCREAGFDAVFEKPADVERVMAALRADLA